MFKFFQRNPIPLKQPGKLRLAGLAAARKTEELCIHMTNYEVARIMICQAMDYVEIGDVDTVMSYLKYAEELLQKPEEENYEHPGTAWNEGFNQPVVSTEDIVECPIEPTKEGV